MRNWLANHYQMPNSPFDENILWESIFYRLADKVQSILVFIASENLDFDFKYRNRMQIFEESLIAFIMHASIRHCIVRY
jgi:hypothetical protein